MEYENLILLVELVLIGIPLISFLISRLLIRNKILAVYILCFSCAVIEVGIFIYFSEISFVNLNFDIYAEIFIFISLCFVIWITPALIDDLLLKITIQSILIIPIILSLISGTVGLLGVLWVVGDNFKPDKELRLTENLTYKEKNTGMAFSGPHLNVFVTKRLDNFGILEKVIFKKEYQSMESSYNDIKVKFEKDSLYLETFPDSNSVIKEKFKDTIFLKE